MNKRTRHHHKDNEVNDEENADMVPISKEINKKEDIKDEQEIQEKEQSTLHFAGYVGVGRRLAIFYIDLFFIWLFPVNLYLYFRKGETLGRKFFAVKIIHAYSGELPSFGSLLFRFVFKVLNILTLGLSFIFILKNERKQGIHDKISTTVVVKTEEKRLWGVYVFGLLPFLITLFLVFNLWDEYDRTGQISFIENNYKIKDFKQISQKESELNVLQGAIERSTVNPIKSMVSLIEAQRKFEQSQKAIRGIDELNRKVISDIGSAR